MRRWIVLPLVALTACGSEDGEVATRVAAPIKGGKLANPLPEVKKVFDEEEMAKNAHFIDDFERVATKAVAAKDYFLLVGPPGTGKTTLANIIANSVGKKYIKLNAVNCGVKEIKEIIDENKRDLFSYNGIVLMLDEIQALNKKQQQSLLEVIEDGSVTLIASTADNPYFVIYKAILSRSSIFEFKPIN